MNKNIRKTLSLLLGAGLLLSSSYGLSQNKKFVKSGKIEFQKSINMFAIIKKNINKSNEAFWQTPFTEYKQNNPQFKVLKSTLTFSNNKTLFVPNPEPDMKGFFKDLPMTKQNNTVSVDLTSRKQLSEKKVDQDYFLVSDTTNKIIWKLTGEIREVAGYDCRRANGIIGDSIYVVAFYTDQIPVSGGPESFNGLPGMILEVALPHENIIWKAIKVEDFPNPLPLELPSKKGKTVNLVEFRDILRAYTKGNTIRWKEYLL